LDAYVKSCKACIINNNTKNHKTKIKTIKKFYFPLQCIVIDYSELYLNQKNNIDKSYMFNGIDHISR
jgi:hypothetical protein